MPAIAELLSATVTKVRTQSVLRRALPALHFSSFHSKSIVQSLPYYRRPSLLTTTTVRRRPLVIYTSPSTLSQNSPPLFLRTKRRHPHSGVSAQFHRGYWNRTVLARQSWSPNSDSQAQLSGFGGWTGIVAIGICVGAGLVYQTQRASLEDINEQGVELGIEENVQKAAEKWSKMTGESLLGRPGNLTSEQEAKLRELWIATLQVFGVLDAEHAKEVNAHNIDVLNGPNRSDTIVSEKPKKRRIAIFGRKHKDSDTESVTSNDSPSTTPTKAAAENDDKYGQTKVFHDTLAKQSPETLRATFWSMVKHDHPDALLLRFLRARKWDVEKALIMMISTMNWRHSDMHVDDDIMKNGEEGAFKISQGSDAPAKKNSEDFITQMRMGKSFLHGTDKSGRPMCFIRVRLHRQGEQTEESLERYTVFIIESARMLLSPPIDTAVSLDLNPGINDTDLGIVCRF
jgi:hypothetical protein